jgi:hypothetical protein
MPFQSEKQRRFLHANHPEIAKRWERDYANGGILDIDASEEITTDDGNDIELTDYNAAFDEPTGVKTLFQAKDGGGTPQLAKKSKDGKRPGYAGEDWDWSGLDSSPSGPAGGQSSGGNYGGGQQHHDHENEFAGISVWKDVDTGDASIAEDIAAKERKRQQELKDLIDKGEDEKKDYVEIPKHKSKLGPLGNRPKMTVTLKQAKKFAEMDKYVDEILDKFTKTGAIYAGTKFIGNTVQDLIPFIGKFMPEYFPKVNLHGEVITDHVTGSDLGWFQDTDWEGVDPEFEKDWDGLWKKGPDDTGGDGPEVPQVVPVHEEIQEYEDTYTMSPWERIKANQARRALLVEKGILQENPIVDESVTDITMEANKGGLANLFRVKNQ